MSAGLIRIPVYILMIIPLITGFIDKDGTGERNSHPAGYIDIIVESNANRLFFTYNLGEGCIPVDKERYQAMDEEKKSSVVLSIPVRDFQCANAMVYSDFLTLLKANQYPLMQIIIPPSSFIKLQNNDTSSLHEVIITIAGVSRDYDILCTIDNRIDNSSVLMGTARIMLTDLEIEPPVKFLGLVKVKDEIIVNFGFCLEDRGAITGNF